MGRRTACLAIVATTLAAGCSSASKGAASGAPGFEAPWPWPDATGVATTIVLSFPWTGSGATFDVYLATTAPAATLIDTVSATTLLVSGLANATTYRWRVVAHGGGGATESAGWSFTTGTGSYDPAAMATVTGGTFTAGTTPATVSTFRMDVFEVTAGLWTSVATWGHANGYADLELSPGNPLGPDYPVAMVSWYDAVKWCNARSEMEGLAPAYFTSTTQTTVYRTGYLDLANGAVAWSATGYRLPTEVESDYASRGGASSHGYRYAGGDIAFDVAWYADDSASAAHAVGTRSANELGLYDLSGNVYETIWDWYSPAYPAGGTLDPRGAATGDFRMVRGGSLLDPVEGLDVARRAYDADGPSHASWVQGFRTVRRP